MNFFDPRPLKCLKIADFYYVGVKSRRSDDDLRVKVTPFDPLGPVWTRGGLQGVNPKFNQIKKFRLQKLSGMFYCWNKFSGTS